MSPEFAGLAMAFLAGALIGGAYAALLWASVRGLRRARRPAAVLIGGGLLRLGLVMGAFYLVMDGRWERLLACLAGFLLVRVAATRAARAHG